VNDAFIKDLLIECRIMKKKQDVTYLRSAKMKSRIIVGFHL